MSGDTGSSPARRPRKLARAMVGPGPLRELKDLLFEVYTAACEPSLDEIATAIARNDALRGAPSRDTIRRCISDPGVPAQQSDAVAIAVALANWASWDANALASRMAELWVKARLMDPPGKPLAEVTDPFALEVHRAISTDLLNTGPGLPVLPAYVERDHDAWLRAAAEDAKRGVSRLVMLTGGSSTGKTRACWEALRHLPHGWRLWHPYDPTRPEAALAAIEQVAPHTVVWLNEAQNYLLTLSDLGERLAAKLRTLLADPGRAPVLVLGTLWPEYWRTLTLQPEPGHADPHGQARALLVGHDLPVPPVFSDTDLRALADRAVEDPRLAYAADHAENGAIAQYLAGAPALLERYRTAPDGARALIEAAMDARRLGHGPALPLALLEAAAPGYLTDTQWDLLDDDWLEQALAYNAKPLRGARGPLTRIRARPGHPAATQPHYRLADYLEQHSRRHRHATRTPAALWNAVIDHASAADRLPLAQAAQTRGLLRVAVHLCATTAGTDEVPALQSVAEWLADAGRLNEALTWYERAVHAGNTKTLLWAAEQLAQVDRLDYVLPWIERAADAGDTTALRWMALLRARANRLNEALTWAERATDMGDTGLLRWAAGRLVVAGRMDDALAWIERAVDAGGAEALRWVADFMLDVGPRADALTWYERAADAGDTEAPGAVGALLATTGRLDEALPWLQQAADAGETEAPGAAAALLAAAGRLDEALTWAERAVAAGDTEALQWTAESLVSAGRLTEALTWYQRVADAGHTEALRWAADLLAAAGQLDEALTWYKRAVDAGDTEALRWAADLLAAAGRLVGADRLDEAPTWVEHAVMTSGTEAQRWAAESLAAAGRLDEAMTWVELVVDASAEALRWAADLLAAAGELDDALAWYERAVDAGDTELLGWVAHLLAASDRLDEALTWSNRAADTGDNEALGWAAERLADANRLDDALPWYERAGRARALRWAAERLADANRLEEALAWVERAADAGDAGALRWAAERLADANRLEEALTWANRAADAGDTAVLGWVAEWLAEANRLDEALPWAKRAADAGDAAALGWAAVRLAEANRLEEALDWYGRAADAGDAAALGWAAKHLADAGHLDEAEQLRRYGWEPDRSIAQTWDPPMSALSKPARNQ
ncbi:CDC27 family protein [Streptomyces sviceus]|uniref:CDC27 family protein n=1 Tax=Streptomyces sviceus TaxID=285530 RepID=UPI0036AFB3EB